MRGIIQIALTAVFLILMLYVIVLLWAAARVLNDASNYLNRPEFRSDGQFTMDFNFDKDSGSGKIGGTIFESAGSIARAGSNWTFVTMIYWIIVTVVMTFGIILRIYFYFEIWRAMGRIKAANKRANRGTTADATPTGIVVEQSTTPLVADKQKEAPEQVDNDDGEQAEENVCNKY